MNKLLIPAALMLATLFTGCATRQVTDELGGSTGQRLVSYSIEKWIDELPAEPFESLRDQAVAIETRFIQQTPASTYASDLLKINLLERFQITSAPRDEARYELLFFFNSLGTDADYAGLSLPFVDLSGGGDGSRIDLLALDMYHGVTEGHFVLKDKDSGSVTRYDRRLARIRTDSLSTPIIKIPISNLER